MLLHIFNNDFERLGVIDSYVSSTWEEYYQNVGHLALFATDNTENINLLRMGNIIFRQGKDTAMRIVYVKYDSANRQIEVHALTTIDLIAQRIIAKTENINNVEQGMYNIVQNNIRGLPNVIVSDSQGFEERYESQYTGGNVVDTLINISVETGLGFIMTFNPKEKKHIFKVYRGVSRISGQREPTPAIFSEEFENLDNMIIVNDDSVFRNVAYVAGAGEGEERKIIIVGDADGLDRYELWVDARDIQPNEAEGETIDSDSYIQKLIVRGIDKLNEQIKVKTFIAEINPMDFGIKYNLGDIVSCTSSKYKIQINTRIMHFKETTENNMTKISLTLGNPEITLMKEVLLNV